MKSWTTRTRSTALAVFAAASALIGSSSAGAVPAAFTPAAYSRAVTGVCAHALLFEGTHAIGTREGALEVADDIRASSRRRLALVAALSTPPVETRLAARWLALEQRLADMYATSYVAIYDLIALPWTPEQAAVAPGLLATLVHAPDALRQAAGRLEQQLQVPDCIGG